MTDATKTPAQAKKEADQKAWDDKVELKLDTLTKKYPDSADHAQVSAFYRELYALRVDIEQTTPALKNKYNVAVQTLFGNYATLPAALFIDASTPRP